MQLRTAFAFAIYIGSYLPLSVILLAQDTDFEIVRRGVCPVKEMLAFACASPLKDSVIALSTLCVCALGFAITVIAMRMLPTPKRVTVLESKHIPADLINYVIPYVVSFISLDYRDMSKFVGFGVFIAWIFWITLKSGQIILNPLLAVIGWRLYEVKYRFHGSTNIFVGRMLSRVEIEPDQDYHIGNLQDVIIVRENS